MTHPRFVTCILLARTTVNVFNLLLHELIYKVMLIAGCTYFDMAVTATGEVATSDNRRLLQAEAGGEPITGMCLAEAVADTISDADATSAVSHAHLTLRSHRPKTSALLASVVLHVYWIDRSTLQQWEISFHLQKHCRFMYFGPSFPVTCDGQVFQ